jgi:hypothetical protein
MNLPPQALYQPGTGQEVPAQLRVDRLCTGFDFSRFLNR